MCIERFYWTDVQGHQFVLRSARDTNHKLERGLECAGYPHISHIIKLQKNNTAYLCSKPKRNKLKLALHHVLYLLPSFPDIQVISVKQSWWHNWFAFQQQNVSQRQGFQVIRIL